MYMWHIALRTLKQEVLREQQEQLEQLDHWRACAGKSTVTHVPRTEECFSSALAR